MNSDDLIINEYKNNDKIYSNNQNNKNNLIDILDYNSKTNSI